MGQFPIACSRGLARIPDTGTENAFWCVVGRPGCRDTADPICVALGYGETRDEGESPQQNADRDEKNEGEETKNSERDRVSALGPIPGVTAEQALRTLVN